MRRGGAPVDGRLVKFVGGGGTFARASEASYYTAPPNTAGGFLSWAPTDTIREDKRDGVTGLYLFEAPQTNLCLYSEALDNAAWATTLCSVGAGVTTAPDGEVDCKTISFTANAGAKLTQANIAGTADAVFYITSAWVRKASAGNVRLSFLLRDGTTATTADKVVGSTWTRIEDLRSWGTGATVPSAAIQNAVAGTAQDVEVWGFDIKSNVVGGTTLNAVSSVVRTTNLAVARAGDDMTWPVTPAAMLSGHYHFAFSPIYSSTEASEPSAYYTTGTTVNGIDSRTGVSYITTQLANVAKTSSLAISYGRNTVMNADVNLPAAINTITGAASGNGPGAQGLAVTFAQAALYAGRVNAATKFYSNARIGEPYALPATAPFDPNSIANLVIDINPEFDAAGAVVSVLDRKSGYAINGTATRDAAINGYPTYTGNGVSDILTSTAAIAQLSGASAVTVIAVHVSGAPGAAGKVIYSYGGGVGVGEFTDYTQNPSTPRIIGSITGNVGNSAYYVADAMTAAAVWTHQDDMSLATGEASLFRKNGAVVGATLTNNANNTGTLASRALSLFALPGPSAFWSGSINRLLIYSRALSAGEMQSIERALGLKAGILVA